jgi:segregation and condensation protein B
MPDTLPIKQIIEGAIMAAEQPLTVDQMLSLFEGEQPARSDVRAALKEIEQDCEGRGFELKTVASGYRFQVRTEYGEWVARLWKEKPPRYTRALLETLALVAYKQPITRGDIEEVRGVAVSTNIMRTLLEREWVRIVGHRDVPGHPALYATTKSFLDYFNLRGLDELPSLAEIKDLTTVNEELDLVEELIEFRSIDVDEAEQEAVADFEDADLDEVSETVNTIQENIRTLFASDEEEADEEDEDEDDQPEHSEAGQDQQEAVEPVESTLEAPPEETPETPDTEAETAEPENRSATVTPISSAMNPVDSEEESG